MASNRKTLRASKGGGKVPILGIAVIAVAAAIIGGMTLFAGGSSTPKPLVVPTSPVPSSNISASLAAFRGKVVILDFWATWCGPCRMEIPGFVSLQNKYRDRGLEIVGVSLDLVTGQRNPAVVAPFMKQFGINYTVFTVSDNQALEGYGSMSGIPTTFIIDRQGNIIGGPRVGYHPESYFENEIKPLL